MWGGDYNPTISEDSIDNNACTISPVQRGGSCKDQICWVWLDLDGGMWSCGWQIFACPIGKTWCIYGRHEWICKVVLYREFVAYLLSPFHSISTTEGLTTNPVGMQDWLLFQGSVPCATQQKASVLDIYLLISNKVLSDANQSVCLFLFATKNISSKTKRKNTFQWGKIQWRKLESQDEPSCSSEQLPSSSLPRRKSHHHGFLWKQGEK